MEVVDIKKIFVPNLLIYIYLHCVRSSSWCATMLATLMNMLFMDECAIYGRMCYFWMNVPFLDECAANFKNIAFFIRKTLVDCTLLTNTLDLLFIFILSDSFHSFRDKHQTCFKSAHCLMILVSLIQRSNVWDFNILSRKQF